MMMAMQINKTKHDKTRKNTFELFCIKWRILAETKKLVAEITLEMIDI